MSFIARWLNLAKDRRPIGLRPHREFELQSDYDVAFDRVVAAVEQTLGAHVAVNDRTSGTIEGAFGLVNNERLRCTLQRRSDGRIGVRIEAFFRAGTSVRQHSLAVDTLADVLQAQAR